MQWGVQDGSSSTLLHQLKVMAGADQYASDAKKVFRLYTLVYVFAVGSRSVCCDLSLPCL
jgi:hypothetical protein